MIIRIITQTPIIPLDHNTHTNNSTINRFEHVLALPCKLTALNNVLIYFVLQTAIIKRDLITITQTPIIKHDLVTITQTPIIKHDLVTITHRRQ